MMKSWHSNSWKNYQAKQQPFYLEQEKLDSILEKISSYPNVIQIKDIYALKTKLAKAARGEVFILQAGDCAERFIDSTKECIFEKVHALQKMKLLLELGLNKETVCVGRIAGQYAKPRSSIFEETPEGRIYNFRGDNINSFEYSQKGRKAVPERLEQGYLLAQKSYAYILQALHELPVPQQKKELVNFFSEIENFDRFYEFETLLQESKSSVAHSSHLYISHEGLHLPLEAALTRKNSTDNLFYNIGAHTLWIGERTRFIQSAHIEYARGIANPLGIKISHETSRTELIEIIKKLNPRNEEGKITLITRLGAKKVRDTLPALIQSIEKHNLNVVWMCDPMHGNSYKTNSGLKTRNFSTLMEELKETFTIHQEQNSCLAGIHLESSGQSITECVGGSLNPLNYDDLAERYETQCDPRLSYSQGLEIAMRFSQLVQGNFNLLEKKEAPSFSAKLSRVSPF